MILGIDASRAVTNRPTGTEAYARELIGAIAPLSAERGHQLRLYYNQPPIEPLTPYPHESIIIPSKRLWTHTRLARELHANRPDVFFTPAHVIPFTYRGASVATVHDLGFRKFPNAHAPKQRAYLNWSTKHNATRSSLVFADSQATKQDLIDIWSINPEKIAVLYPGRDKSLQPIIAEDALSQVAKKYAISRPYLIYLGTLQPRKNLVRLIEAFCTISHTIPHQLVLAGNVGWLSEDIVSLASQYPDRILITGFIDEADKSALLSGADGLLFPSLYEGFGFPVLEGFACGTAVLTANSSSLPEVAGNAAHFVNPLDAKAIAEGIQKICTDAPYREQLQQQGFIQQMTFDWQKTANQAMNLLEKVNV